jgi:hypothetical protein
MFSGNYDRSSIVRHVLTRIIFTNRIRIHPKTWITNAGLRLEFAGCNFGKRTYMTLILAHNNVFKFDIDLMSAREVVRSASKSWRGKKTIKDFLFLGLVRLSPVFSFHRSALLGKVSRY